MCGEEGACVAKGGMHGEGGCVWQGEHAWQGVCMAGGMCGRGHAWWGACMACMGHACHACLHTYPPQILWLRHTVNERAVRILLECILVLQLLNDSL